MKHVVSYVKIEVFLPETSIEALRDGLHAVNVGRIGHYDHCLSISDVRGYWRPLEGASPYAGEIGHLQSGQECKVEVSCRYETVSDAIRVIRQVHPYEPPLINVLPLLNHQFEGLAL